ncbi:MAG: hypothetical protein LBJ86_06990 [Spirochaetaceae bacterium]|jgi:hypothetical protein|nr:hypothetical protein [Spirochaetaceae bacterium]
MRYCGVSAIIQNLRFKNIKHRAAVLLFCLVPLAAGSCFAERQADIVLGGADGESYPLYARQNATQGIFNLSKTKRYDYSLNKAVSIPPGQSLEIAYSLQESSRPARAAPGSGGGYRIVVKTGGDSGWELPASLDFLATGAHRIRYAVPLQKQPLKSISFEITGAEDSGADMRVEGLRLTERFYGFDTQAGLASPFVGKIVSEYGGEAILIRPDERYGISGPEALFIKGIMGGTEITAGGFRFSYIEAGNGEAGSSLTVPSAFLDGDKNSVRIDGGVSSALLRPEARDEHATVTADPGFVLVYPQDKWRGADFEVFRWERFPNILIFDTASYEAQDRLFKRLAFFAEKKGFKGRLARDAEIAALHGWNAHDYSAETLARFFDLAEKTSFRLSGGELALRELLVETAVINRTGGGFSGGDGAVISISRESPDYLRLTFMAHEGFHGIFFIDADFREFCQRRWDNLDGTAKRFIVSYFDSQQYDIGDQYLVLNEFMAHCLQQGVSASGRYFGENLAGRLYERSPWRRAVLPPKDEAAGNWPAIAESFRAEAAALSGYAHDRWGLAAGRVWGVRP